MTKRLFDNKPYESVFQTTVTHIGEGFVILDQTVFDPLSGHQQCDKGTRNDVEVIAVKAAVLTC